MRFYIQIALLLTSSEKQINNSSRLEENVSRLTLYFGDSTGKDLLLSLGLSDVGKDLVNDGFSELCLLTLLELLLVTNPAVKDRLEFGGNSHLLLLDKGLRLELGCFLWRE